MNFLFHPKITAGACIAALGAIAVYIPDIKATFGAKGLLFCIGLSVLIAVCTFGRSPAPAVDNAK